MSVRPQRLADCGRLVRAPSATPPGTRIVLALSCIDNRLGNADELVGDRERCGPKAAAAAGVAGRRGGRRRSPYFFFSGLSIRIFSAVRRRDRAAGGGEAGAVGSCSIVGAATGDVGQVGGC